MPSGIIFTAAVALCLACVSAQNLPPPIAVSTCSDNGYVTTDVDPDAMPCDDCQSELSFANSQANWAKAVLRCFRNPRKPVWHEANWSCLWRRLAAPFPSVQEAAYAPRITWIAQTVSGRAAAPLRAIARCARV
jgi:hypothetical protein